ncbi:coenzyme A transferase, partial [mine drainage metagenome]
MPKLVSLDEAVRRYVPDGSRVALGLCLESNIPFALGYAIARARRRNLTLIGPISDILFDLLIGAG